MTDNPIPIILLPHSTNREDCAGLDRVNWRNKTELADMFRYVPTALLKHTIIKHQCSSLTESTHKRYDADFHREVSTKCGRKASISRSVTFADIIKTIGTPSEPSCNGIPVRIAQRGDSSDYKEFTQ